MIEVALLHAAESGLAIDYRLQPAEAVARETPGSFEVVCCMEMLEHVPDPAAFIKLCAALVRPGGLLLLSTINRTLKSYLLAIVGAEYVLRWLPVGTHRWERFVAPLELERHLATAGLGNPAFKGLVYSPLSDAWSLADDTDVNYFAAAAKPQA